VEYLESVKRSPHLAGGIRSAMSGRSRDSSVALAVKIAYNLTEDPAAALRRVRRSRGMYNFVRMGLTEHRAPKGEGTPFAQPLYLRFRSGRFTSCVASQSHGGGRPRKSGRIPLVRQTSSSAGGCEEGTGSAKGSQEWFVSAESNDQDV
jgi:hypothetical protein